MGGFYGEKRFAPQDTVVGRSPAGCVVNFALEPDLKVKCVGICPPTDALSGRGWVKTVLLLLNQPRLRCAAQDNGATG